MNRSVETIARLTPPYRVDQGSGENEMNELGKCTWQGASGREYVYTRYRADTPWPTVSANYICAKAVKISLYDNFEAKYIGETGNLADRMRDHEKWPCCDRNGVNEIHINTDAKFPEERRRQEADLVARYDPPCNN